MKKTPIPSRTREILGEHLHQKVKEVQDISDQYNGLVSKVTGMLFDAATVEDIYKMLMDENVLKNNVRIAVESLKKHRVLNSVQSNLKTGKNHDQVASFERKTENGLKTEHEIVEPKRINSGSESSSWEMMEHQLYDQVYQFDPKHASQITGMLLELDKEIICDLLDDDSKFLSAFKKAQSCLIERDTCQSSDSTTLKDSSLLIFKRAKEMYEQDAPQITGMILELDQKTLQLIIRDKKSLDMAIVKAFTALGRDTSSS